MASTRKQYTSEFKHQAVRLVTEQVPRVAQAARDLGLNDNVLARWKRELAQQCEHAFPSTGRAQEDGLARLRREREVEVLWRESLKKPWVCSCNSFRQVPVHPRVQESVRRPGDVPSTWRLAQ